MAFACQRNSYLKELLCTVMSCVNVGENYEVVLNDTVFFPEGGGQPDDRGEIGNIDVHRVLRRGPQAVHLTKQPVLEGQQYTCRIDWRRRFDHMQQHSAQHLLSAVADIRFGFKTVSWEMGSLMSHVELDTPTILQEQIIAIETECNAKIRQHSPVTVQYLTKNEAMQLQEVKSRGLPEDVAEPIRVIEIEDVDKNMCCGTHVNNLSDLQAIKFLHTDTMRGGTRLFFIAGNRLLKKLTDTYDVERKMTKLLSCGLEEHPDSVEKLKNNLRVTLKANKSYLKEIAKWEAEEMARNSKDCGYIFKYREDADMDYIFTFLNSLPEHSKDILVFVCAGTVKTGGQFILRGNDELLKKLTPRILTLIEGKGGGKKGQVQGKAASFKNLKLVEEAIQSILAEK